MTKRFCEDCGRELSADKRFCGECGATVATEPGEAGEPRRARANAPSSHTEQKRVFGSEAMAWTALGGGIAAITSYFLPLAGVRLPQPTGYTGSVLAQSRAAPGTGIPASFSYTYALLILGLAIAGLALYVAYTGNGYASFTVFASAAVGLVYAGIFAVEVAIWNGFSSLLAGWYLAVIGFGVAAWATRGGYQAMQMAKGIELETTRQPGANEKRCPYCDRIILKAARICRYCDRDLTEAGS